MTEHATYANRCCQEWINSCPHSTVPAHLTNLTLLWHPCWLDDWLSSQSAAHCHAVGSICTAYPLYIHTDCLLGSLTTLFCPVFNVNAIYHTWQGVWSKRRQTKTATVKTATNQNGDKLYGQNGDTVSAKTATNYIVKTATTIGLFVMFLLCLTVHLR